MADSKDYTEPTVPVTEVIAVLAAMQRSFEAMSKRLATSDSEYAQGHEFGYRAAAQSAADYMGIAIESFKGRL